MTNRSFPARRGLPALIPAILLAAACSQDEPLAVGFVGGLSGPNASVSLEGLNATRLAIDHANREGGIRGRRLELVVEDDGQDPTRALEAAQRLAAAGVVAVIGPFTSTITATVAPELQSRDILVISPTATALGLHGRDDNLVRINRTTRDNARDYAATLARRGLRRIAVAYDTRNDAFTLSWATEFEAALRERGGVLAANVPYASGPGADFRSVVDTLVAARPDGLLFVSGATDTARLAKEARIVSPRLPVAASEWAATEDLAEIGGEAIEGLLIVQAYDRDDRSPRYREFRDAYASRFRRPPGYSSVAAWDAVTVLVEGLRRAAPGETAKRAVLGHGPYPGLQQEIAFDANGDTTRRVFFTQVREGRYEPLRP